MDFRSFDFYPISFDFRFLKRNAFSVGGFDSAQSGKPSVRAGVMLFLRLRRSRNSEAIRRIFRAFPTAVREKTFPKAILRCP